MIGGTGPTGIPLVDGLVRRGHNVTILHRGLHERAETPAVVEHVHADPYDEHALRAALEGRTFDVIFAMYGRLRAVAECVRGRVGQFVSVGGVPAYRGFMNPWLHEPLGLPVPIAEDAPTVQEPDEDEKGYRIARTEEIVFEHHPDAAHFRYPYVYGPYQLVPREWLVVRRVLDGRRRIVVADDGLTLHHHGYTENLAHALLLAVEHPDAAAGKIFNVGDEEVLSVRQVVEIVARRSVTSSRSCRCRTTSPFRRARCSRSRCRPIACSTSRGSVPISATATSCRRARRSRAPRAGSRNTRSSVAGRRSGC